MREARSNYKTRARRARRLPWGDGERAAPVALGRAYFFFATHLLSW
jgi:hypothetical protein